MSEKLPLVIKYGDIRIKGDYTETLRSQYKIKDMIIKRLKSRIYAEQEKLFDQSNNFLYDVGDETHLRDEISAEGAIKGIRTKCHP